MIQTISHCPLLYNPYKYRERWLLVILAHLIWLIMGFISPLIGFDVMLASDWSPPWLLRSYVARAKYVFFLHDNLTLSQVRPLLSDITPGETILGILQVFINGSHDMQTRIIISGFGICCITIWCSVKNFEKVISVSKRNDEKKMLEIHRQFNTLRRLCDSINTVWYLLCYWYILDITVWLATDLDKALRTKDWFVKAHMIFFMFYDGVVITLSAESFRKMHSFRQWILKGDGERDEDNWQIYKRSRKEIKFLLQEVSEATIGVGSAGFYHIDYAFLGQSKHPTILQRQKKPTHSLSSNNRPNSKFPTSNISSFPLCIPIKKISKSDEEKTGQTTTPFLPSHLRSQRKGENEKRGESKLAGNSYGYVCFDLVQIESFVIQIPDSISEPKPNNIPYPDHHITSHQHSQHSSIIPCRYKRKGCLLFAKELSPTYHLLPFPEKTTFLSLFLCNSSLLALISHAHHHDFVEKAHKLFFTAQGCPIWPKLSAAPATIASNRNPPPSTSTPLQNQQDQS
ncbi:unnamed protein product [Orchesella dallaii]|uniref:Uncharacterized protein n=1 Tax=Orchesella dallaii TaxID=48710 RepID=A0ABP1RT89_9HEXA